MNPYVYSRKGKDYAARPPQPSVWPKIVALFNEAVSSIMVAVMLTLAAGTVFAASFGVSQTDLDMSTATIAPLHQTSGKVLGDTTMIFYPYPTGTLVNDNSTIYFISGTAKVPFTSMQAFSGLGYSLKNVVEGDLTNYTLPQSYTIGTPNADHPWGSWLIYRGTVYYSTEAGLIGVPSAAVFDSNGGSWTYIVKANKYDVAILNSHSSLPILAANDPRVFLTPTYQNVNSINPPVSTSTLSSMVATAPVISGSLAVQFGASSNYSVVSTDQNNLGYNGGLITYTIDWGDGSVNNVSNPLPSGVAFSTAHTWSGVGSVIMAVTATPALGTAAKTSQSITVSQSPIVFSASPAFISFNSANVGPTQIILSNGLASRVNWQASSTVSWLSLSNGVSGMINGNSNNTVFPLVATANANGLAVGTYSGQILVTGNFTAISIPVTLVVTSSTNMNPALSATVSTINLNTVTGGSNNFTQFNLTNNNSAVGATYSISVSPNSSWLSVTPQAGTVPANGSVPVVATVNTNLLTALNYSGNLAINYSFLSGASGVINIPVTVIIAPTTASPSLSLSQSSFNFNYTAGGALPGIVNATVTNSSNNSSITYTQILNNQPAWLNTSYSMAPISLSPGQSAGLGVLVDPSKVGGPGTYTTNIVLSGNFTNSPITIPIVLTVTNSASSGSVYDYNNDGKVDQSDSSILLNVVTNAPGFGACPSGKICDINGDGVVNLNDLLLFNQTNNIPSGNSQYDYNNDGKIDQSDSGILLNVSTGAPGFSSCPTGKTCDINGDGVVNLNDLLLFNQNNSINTSSAFLSKNPAIVNQNISRNAKNQRIGSFIIKTSSADAVRVISFAVSFTGSYPVSSFTNLYLQTPVGPTALIAPSSSNTIPVSFTIGANQMALIDVYADVSNATGDIMTNLSARGVAAASQLSVYINNSNAYGGAPIQGQNITVY